MKLLIIGSHPCNTNGYSKVLYNLVSELSSYPDTHIIVYGVQKKNQMFNRKFSSNVIILDVFQDECSHNEYSNGFYYSGLLVYLDVIKPDIVIIYNDIYVCHQYLEYLEYLECH